MSDQTLMAAEAAEAPDVVRRALAANQDLLGALGEELRRQPPSLVLTCARGSSDHAALFGKYLIEQRLRVPVASMAPSVVSAAARSASPVMGRHPLAPRGEALRGLPY